jgi:glycosyltransferase involved in cell wall biosynthesis
MRVLHLRNSDRFGGPERLILDQVTAASDDVSHAVASFGAEGAPHPLLDRARDAGIDSHLVAQKGSYDPRVLPHVRALVRELAPDVVVGHDYKANLVLALGAGKRPRVALVHGYTAEDVKVRLLEAFDRRVVRAANVVVVVSDALRDLFAEANVPPEKIHRITNGVNVDRVAEAARAGRDEVRGAWGFGEDDRVVLVLGRLSPEKGQDLALEAFASLAPAHASARLVLVGDGALRPTLEARARAPDLDGRVRFEGWRDDPWRCLGAADAFLLPSRREGLPLALLEAMAARVPVVATDVGAVRDALVEDGACGRLVPPEDASALSQALAETLRDVQEGTTSRRVEPAFQHVREHFSVERQVRALEAIYAGLVSR